MPDNEVFEERRLFGRPITLEERSAISALERLAKRWPQSLRLFSNTGTLFVVPNDGADQPWPMNRILATIAGIPNDGGDADWLPAEEAQDVP